MGTYPAAAHGLRTMLTGQILCIVGTVLFFIPLVGRGLTLAGSLLYILGMDKARTCDEGYQKAFIASILLIAVHALTIFLPDSTLLSSLSTLCSLTVIYFVCHTTARLLENVGESQIAALGIWVWRISLFCEVASLLLSPLFQSIWLAILALLPAIILLIVGLVEGVLYLVFLSKSWKVL